MIARELIKDDVPPIKPFESMEKALDWMDEFRVSHLPVVDGSQYYGLVSENMIESIIKHVIILIFNI